MPISLTKAIVGIEPSGSTLQITSRLKAVCSSLETYCNRESTVSARPDETANSTMIDITLSSVT